MTNQNPAVHTTGSEGWKLLISSGARDMGIVVTPHQMAQLTRYAQMLSEWNRRINLTAITDPGEVAVKHFLDSMAALPHLPETGRLLDIGSGGGFPGLVLGIFRPELSITSIDSVRKKISFQQYLIRTLGLSSARALHTRAETLSVEDDRYDIIVSRALGSLEMFTGLALPLVAEEGTMVAYKGVMDGSAETEIENLKAHHPELFVAVHDYRLPASGDRRSLVFMRPMPYETL